MLDRVNYVEHLESMQSLMFSQGYVLSVLRVPGQRHKNIIIYSSRI